MPYAAAFIIGSTETLYDTSAQSILPQLVPTPVLDRANGRLQAVELATNQFTGPPLGGLLAAAGAALAVATPAGALLVGTPALTGNVWVVGAAFGGLFGEWWGLPAVFAIMGVLTLSTLVGLVWVTDRHIAEAEASAQHAAG